MKRTFKETFIYFMISEKRVDSAPLFLVCVFPFHSFRNPSDICVELSKSTFYRKCMAAEIPDLSFNLHNYINCSISDLRAHVVQVCGTTSHRNADNKTVTLPVIVPLKSRRWKEGVGGGKPFKPRRCSQHRGEMKAGGGGGRRHGGRTAAGFSCINLIWM